MMAALEVDYERLEALREERAELDKERRTTDSDTAEGAAAELALQEWDMENAEELSQLEADAGECSSRDEAAERIQEDPLSIEVRSGWVTPGQEMKAEDFVILLCTGGPAVRIRGELDGYKQPHRAWLEVQDWGTPWTQYFDASQDVLVSYASQFYFGE